MLPLIPDHPGHFIGGRFVTSVSRRTYGNVAPASDEILAEIPLGDAADIDLAACAAKTALIGPWGRSSAKERALVLRRIGELILENREALARLESLDTGKPISETLNGDIPRAAQNLLVFSELAAHQATETYFGEDGSRHTVAREPLGVVGLITPWNLPLYLATWKLAPALAQGNTVVLKPAELTPLTAMAMGQLFVEAGLPPGVVNVVQGFGPESAGEALVRHPDVRAISFTGETTTGSAIMRAAATSLKKLSFELGGKGASVVFADADIELAAQAVLRAAFRNQGQICLAGSRLIVEKRVAQELLERVVAGAKALKIGDPLDQGTQLGSLISKNHRDKVASYVELAKQMPGVEVLTGGQIPRPQGAYFEPTVIAGVAQDSRLIQEEIFGPVLTVQTFESFDEAMELLNGTPYGLSCAIFSRDQATAETAARRARTGLVWLNCWFVRDLHTPFGGMKKSGIGREGGRHSLEFFSELKTVTTPGF